MAIAKHINTSPWILVSGLGAIDDCPPASGSQKNSQCLLQSCENLQIPWRGKLVPIYSYNATTPASTSNTFFHPKATTIPEVY